MWIVTNNSYLSIVENRNDSTQFVVRARIRGDLENFFGPDVDVIETENSDYRFRVFIDKAVVKSRMIDNINSIDYFNFKDSVKSKDRKTWYTRIWGVMYDVQEDLYGSQKWWETYYNAKTIPDTSYRE
jgi:hypothetical protein